MYLKGQNLRVFIGGSVVAEATNCTITITGNTEDVLTKDDVGLFSKDKVTSNGWQVTVDSLNVNDVGTLITTMKSMSPVTISYDQTSTTDNTTAQTAGFHRSGSAYLTDATFTFNDREWSAKNLQFTGTGELN